MAGNYFSQKLCPKLPKKIKELSMNDKNMTLNVQTSPSFSEESEATKQSREHVGLESQQACAISTVPLTLGQRTKLQ